MNGKENPAMQHSTFMNMIRQQSTSNSDSASPNVIGNQALLRLLQQNAIAQKIPTQHSNTVPNVVFQPSGSDGVLASPSVVGNTQIVRLALQNPVSQNTPTQRHSNSVPNVVFQPAGSNGTLASPSVLGNTKTVRLALQNPVSQNTPTQRHSNSVPNVVFQPAGSNGTLASPSVLGNTKTVRLALQNPVSQNAPTRPSGAVSNVVFQPAVSTGVLSSPNVVKNVPLRFVRLPMQNSVAQNGSISPSVANMVLRPEASNGVSNTPTTIGNVSLLSMASPNTATKNGTPGSTQALVLKNQNGQMQLVSIATPVLNGASSSNGAAGMAAVGVQNSPKSSVIVSPVIPKGVSPSPSAIKNSLHLQSSLRGVSVNPGQQQKLPCLGSPSPTVRMVYPAARRNLGTTPLSSRFPYRLAPHQRLVRPPSRPVFLGQANRISSIAQQQLFAARQSALHGRINSPSTSKGKRVFYLPPPTHDDGMKRFSAAGLDEDIIDVTAMGGVDLTQESQCSVINSPALQSRSCEDVSLISSDKIKDKIMKIAAKRGIKDVPEETVSFICHATESRLRDLSDKLSELAEHRLEDMKGNPECEISQDVKGQLKFLQELHKLEKKRHEEEEREKILRAAKKRSKINNPELRELQQKAKEIQQAEEEELRHKNTNMAALHALQPMKKQKLDLSISGSSQMKPRVKRVNMKDLQFILEQSNDRKLMSVLFKTYLKRN